MSTPINTNSSISELDALDPVNEQVKLSSGTVVVFERLRARQFFKLLRIITHGAIPWIGGSDLLRIDPQDSAEELGGKLLAMVIMAIPDAENEALEFVRAMVKPVGLIERPQIAMNKKDKEHNAALWAALDLELDNPELEDLVSIIEGVIKREAEDLVALGKRLTQLLNLAQKTGQLPPSLNLPTPSSETSSADSPEPSTSSNPSTDTAMTTVSTSPSVSSESKSQPFVSASGTVMQQTPSL